MQKLSTSRRSKSTVPQRLERRKTIPTNLYRRAQLTLKYPRKGILTECPKREWIISPFAYASLTDVKTGKEETCQRKVLNDQNCRGSTPVATKISINFRKWVANASLTELIRRDDAGSNTFVVKRRIILTSTSLDYLVMEYVRNEARLRLTPKAATLYVLGR